VNADLAAELRAHVRDEYEGVFDDAMVTTFVDEALGTATGEQLTGLVARRVAPPATVLDVGAGYGGFVRAARAAGYGAFGVEVQPYEVAVARRIDAAPYVRGSGLALPYGDGSFDAVTLWNVVEHVPSSRALFAEVARVLRPGGVLLVIAPNYGSFRREAHYHVPWVPLLPRSLATRHLRRLGRDPGFFEQHIHYCTNRSVRRELRAAGFAVHDPRLDRLDRVPRPAGPALRLLLGLSFRNPLRRAIRLYAVKR
jgi:SAM-dependent methyltransferase